MKYSTAFKRIIDTGQLGMYELAWLDNPDNIAGRTALYKELDEDIAGRLGSSPHCYSSYYLEQQERLEQAQRLLYRLGNRLAREEKQR